jgi:rod shape-determining protein MreC
MFSMQKRPIIPLLIFLFLAILILLSNNFPPLRFISGAVGDIFRAPKALLYGFKTGDADSLQVKKLKDENAKLVQKLIDYDRTMRDNEALRSQFESAQTRQYKLLPARILGFSGSFANPASLVIDRGADDGIKVNMGVLLQNNLIGKIGKVTPSYAQVSLSLNGAFTTLAKTSDTNAAGIARGNSDFILLDRVSINDTLNTGSILLTAGDIDDSGVGVPPDLVIGKIVSVNRASSLPFQTAKVESSVKFGQLENAFVVIGLAR